VSANRGERRRLPRPDIESLVQVGGLRPTDGRAAGDPEDDPTNTGQCPGPRAPIEDPTVNDRMG